MEIGLNHGPKNILGVISSNLKVANQYLEIKKRINQMLGIIKCLQQQEGYK